VPPDPETLIKQGEKHVSLGENARALSVYQRFLRSIPNHPSRHSIAMRSGQLMLLLARYDDAIKHFKRMAERDGTDTQALYNLAQSLAFANRLEDAAEAAERLLRADPTHVEGIARRANLLSYLGRADEASAVIDESERQGVRHHTVELALAGLAPKLGRMEESVKRMRAILDEGGLERGPHADLLFKIGYLLDKLGRYDDAWNAVSEANALIESPWNAGSFRRSIDRLIEIQGADAIRALPEPMDPASDAVFVLGSPRSGTTLLEQIISAHPDGATAGELPTLKDAVLALTGSPGGVADDPSRLRKVDVVKASSAYLGDLRARTGKAKRRVDKSPGNWQFLGTGSRLTPEAHVIYSVRDPRDTAISCYFRHFVSGHQFTTSMDRLGHYLAAERRLMRHWEQALREGSPRLKMTRAVYEEVVASPEREARRLIEFIGLPWNDACLRFHEKKKIVNTLSVDQAGQGVYAGSTERWRRYERYLAPFLEAFGEGAPEG